MIDWNADGYKDLLLGEGYGRVLFYENIRTNADPDFHADMVYLKAGGTTIDVGDRSRLEVTDWTNDGLPDLLIGSWDGCVYLAEQEFVFEIESISYDSSEGATLVWRSRENDTYSVYSSEDGSSWDLLESGIPSGGMLTQWTDDGACTVGERLYKICVD